jgi:hypothetical protein
MTPATLLAAIPSMLPGLFEAFGNTNADVRKAVVFALVDMCGTICLARRFWSPVLNASSLP